MKSLFVTTILLIYTSLLYAQDGTYETTRASVDGVFYKAIYKGSDQSVSIVKANGKILLRLSSDICRYGSFSSFKFIDFNKDGYKDLLVEYTTNTPGMCDLFLYNKHAKKFTLLKDLYKYPAPENVEGTRLYYSYHHSGCADESWDSDLFKIDNDQIIKIGNIYGEGCDEKKGIFISKLQGKKKILVKEYPISEIEKYKEYKWGFIKQYWQRNYGRFIL